MDDPVDPQRFYRASLREHLDGAGDLAPPWEQFPTYERYTIGWRMGAGESWLHMWHVFVGDLDPAFAVRLAYLQRHPPAPVNWGDHVYGVLYPSAPDEPEEEEAQMEVQRQAELLRMGLLASDASYPIWLRQQQGVHWPWEYADTPEIAARYWTRDLWFWSRQVAELRTSADWVPPVVPASWQACAAPLASGSVPALDLTRGLLSLAQVLSAGRMVPPWQLGARLEDFADTFDNDMGYVDAFRKWVMSAFDDREHLQRYLTSTGVPKDWERWLAERFPLA
jgi:hypothetical protein